MVSQGIRSSLKSKVNIHVEKIGVGANKISSTTFLKKSNIHTSFAYFTHMFLSKKFIFKEIHLFPYKNIWLSWSPCTKIFSFQNNNNNRLSPLDQSIIKCYFFWNFLILKKETIDCHPRPIIYHLKQDEFSETLSYLFIAFYHGTFS